MAASAASSRNLKSAIIGEAVVERLEDPPPRLAVYFVGLSWISYFICGYLICSRHTSEEVLLNFKALPTTMTSHWASMAFFTSLCLNMVTLIFEHHPHKFLLLCIASYVNTLGLTSSLMASQGYSPIWRDVWGNQYLILRLVMWLHATPFMVYLLAVISEFTSQEVVEVIVADVVRSTCLILAHVSTTKSGSVVSYFFAMSLFLFVMRKSWQMLGGALKHVRHHHERHSLIVMRLAVMVVWGLFPVSWFLIMSGIVSQARSETVWKFVDVLAKVVYSSSLLYGNYVTIEQRQKNMMRRVMEGNRSALLELIYPRHVIEAITHHGHSLLSGQDFGTLKTKHDQVTVMFADCVGFTSMAKELEPESVMLFLHELYMRFDDLLDQYQVYKLETVGDCYVVVGGLVKTDGKGGSLVQTITDEQHARSVFEFAKAMLQAATVLMPHNGKPVQLRVGIHSGPVVSGVIGKRMPKFVLVGDTMNTGSRMETTSSAGCIHVSAASYELIRDESLVQTNGVHVKGKGLMDTYLYRVAPPAESCQAGEESDLEPTSVKSTSQDDDLSGSESNKMRPWRSDSRAISETPGE